MRREDELIVSCARTVMPPTLAERVHELLSEKLDWQYVRQASLRHAVLPLLYQNLATFSPDAVPGNILQEMKITSMATVARNLNMATMLLEILALFEGQEIAAVPFKGPVLGEFVYGDLGLRSFSDLDILVWPHDAERAITLLSSCGFTPAFNFSPSQFSAYMKTEDDMVLSDQARGLIVELHWEMSGRYLSRPMNMECVSDRLETVKLLGTDVQNLSSEDLLLYLCVHGTRHLWERFEWICCVAELITSKKDMQWNRVFGLARDLKSVRILHHGLHLVHVLLDVALPVQVTKELTADPVLPHLAEQITQRLFPLYQPDSQGAGGNRFNRLQFQVRDSLPEQVVYGWRQLTEPREADWHWLSLPGSLSFLYIILRPLRQLLKLVRQRVHG